MFHPLPRSRLEFVGLYAPRMGWSGSKFLGPRSESPSICMRMTGRVLWLLEGWTQADQEAAAPEYYPPSGHAAPTQRIIASNGSGGVDDLSVSGPKNSTRGEKV